MPTPRRPRRRRSSPTVTRISGDRHARILTITRRSKKGLRACGRVQSGLYDRKQRRIRDLACGDLWIYLAVEVRRVACRRCGTAKQEQLAFLADNPFYAKALCLLRGPALSRLAHPGYSEGAAARWAHREGDEAAGPARATGAGQNARTAGDRARRGLDQERPHLPHRHQGPGRATPDLVWRPGSLGGEPGPVLRRARARPAQGSGLPARRHGHVETLSPGHRAARSPGQFPVRQSSTSYAI